MALLTPLQVPSSSTAVRMGAATCVSPTLAGSRAGCSRPARSPSPTPPAPRVSARSGAGWQGPTAPTRFIAACSPPRLHPCPPPNLPPKHADPACVNGTTSSLRAISTDLSAPVYSSPAICSASILGALGKCELFQDSSTVRWNECLNGLCLRQVTTFTGRSGWVVNSGVVALPHANCPGAASTSPCSPNPCTTPDACRSGPGICVVVNNAPVCAYQTLLPAGTACDGTSGKQCTAAGVCELPANFGGWAGRHLCCPA